MVNEQYLVHEVKNLARFISVSKIRPILWRISHPYILCDRFEDLTDPEVCYTFCFEKNFFYYRLFVWIQMQNEKFLFMAGSVVQI